MWEPPADHPLRRLFAGLTEHAFLTRLGLADPPLIDYVSTLLSRFVHSDAVTRLKGQHGRPLEELAVMVTEAEALPEGGRTRREYFRHIGDVALFWTGLFPEAITRNADAWGPHAVINYTTYGKRSYYIASRYDDDRFRDEAPVLRRLSEQFELCATGLREVRREWEELAGESPPGPGLIQ
jgi:hypothetical protein